MAPFERQAYAVRAAQQARAAARQRKQA